MTYNEHRDLEVLHRPPGRHAAADPPDDGHKSQLEVLVDGFQY